MKPPMDIKVDEIEKGSSLGRDAWLRLKKNYLAMASLWFFIAVTLICYLGPLVSGVSDPNVTHPDLQSMPPFSEASTGGPGDFIKAATNRDYWLINGTVTVFAVLILFMNFFVDIIQAWLDPRTRSRD